MLLYLNEHKPPQPRSKIYWKSFPEENVVTGGNIARNHADQINRKFGGVGGGGGGKCAFIECVQTVVK